MQNYKIMVEENTTRITKNRLATSNKKRNKKEHIIKAK